MYPVGVAILTYGIFFAGIFVLLRSKLHSGLDYRADVLLPPFLLPPPPFCIYTPHSHHRLLAIYRPALQQLNEKKFKSSLTFMNNVAPIPPTDIIETLSCRHAVATTFVFVFCINATIMLEGEDLPPISYLLLISYVRIQYYCYSPSLRAEESMSCRLRLHFPSRSSSRVRLKPVSSRRCCNFERLRRRRN